MARKSQHGFSKRQRERKKAEKAALKQARRDVKTMPVQPAETSADAPSEEDAVETTAAGDVKPE